MTAPAGTERGRTCNGDLHRRAKLLDLLPSGGGLLSGKPSPVLLA
jgi:hypothetical protein